MGGEGELVSGVFRSEKLPYVLFITAVVTMFLALGWLAFEMNRATEAPETRMPQERKIVRASEGPSKSLPRLVTKDLVAQEMAGFREALAGALESEIAMPNEVLLTLKSDALLHALQLRAGLNGLEIVSLDPKLRLARVRFSDLNDLMKELAAHSEDYESVGPNYLAHVPGLPPPSTDDGNEGGQARFASEGMEAIGAAKDRSDWGRGVTVAVLDTGMVDHSTLSGLTVTHLDLVNDGSEFNGHGTAMASLIAGKDSNAEGVAQAARLLDVRVADADGVSNTALVASGIVKAVDMGARVINVSLGSFGNAQALENAVNYALSRNVVVVAAGGNEQMNMLAYPAALPGVISVGAVDANGQQAYFSNSGESLTLSAPGVGIVSGYTDNQVVIGSGTSQATALVSGVAATLVGWGYSGQNIATLLINNAQPTGAPSSQVGAGIVQVPPR